MAQSGKFGLSVRILATLAQAPETMHTSASLAETLATSPVMVRRVFPALHNAGFITQRKGPQGGARLKASAKSIGLGDVYAAVEPAWLHGGDKDLVALTKRVRQDALAAMNETTIAAIAKKLAKPKP